MPRISEKYVAGFLDADGCIGFNLNEEGHRPALTINFSQKTGKDEVLYAIQSEFGGRVRIQTINGKQYSGLDIFGTGARALITRCGKHLVIKRHYAHVMLERSQSPCGDKAVLRLWKKEQRKIKSLPLPNFPSRKWLAGYFDGDGCLYVSRINKSGIAQLGASIACQVCDSEGIEIICKNFGGRINDFESGRCKQWHLSMPPSKAVEFLSYFGKYSIVKKQEIDFVLGCAAMGHFRDGSNIKTALKQLKSHEQRLSESELELMVGSIRNLDRPIWKSSDEWKLIRNDNGQIIDKVKRQSGAAAIA